MSNGVHHLCFSDGCADNAAGHAASMRGHRRHRSCLLLIAGIYKDNDVHLHVCRLQPLLEVIASTKSGSVSVGSRSSQEASSHQHLTCQAAQRHSPASSVKAAALGAVHGACRAFRWLAGRRQHVQAKHDHMLGIVQSSCVTGQAGRHLVHHMLRPALSPYTRAAAFPVQPAACHCCPGTSAEAGSYTCTAHRS